MTFQFTHQEKSAPKHSISFAIKQAKDVLKDKYNINTICINCLPHKAYWSLSDCTAAEIDYFVNRLIEDTLRYEY